MRTGFHIASVLVVTAAVACTEAPSLSEQTVPSEPAAPPSGPPQASADYPVWEGQLRLRGGAQVDHRRGTDPAGWVVFFAEVTNVDTLPLEGIESVWLLQVYATPERVGSPIWTGRAAHPRQMANIVQLAPGDSVWVFGHTQQRPADILGGHSPGTYYVSASLWFRDAYPGGDGVFTPFRTRYFAAGEITLPQ